MTRQELAQKIKAKYPVYQDMDDMELAEKIIAKHPVYKDQMAEEPVRAASQPAQPESQWQPPSAEEEALQSPDLLPGMVAPENLAPVGMAMKAGVGLVRGLGSKALEQSLKFIPGKTAEMAGEVALPKIAAAAGQPAFNKLTQAAIPDVENIASPTVEQKFLDALKGAKGARSELSRMFHGTRQKHSGVLGEMQSKSVGEQTSYDMLKFLKGRKLAEKPPDFEPLRPKLEQTDIDELVKKVHAAPKLRPFERLKADEGLRKVFDGEIPQPAEIALLKDVFGDETTKQILKLRPWEHKALDIVTSAANLPRALMASADASASLRQGLVLTVSHPKLAAQAYKESWKQTFNPKRYAEWLDGIKGHKLYELMEDSKLYIADPTREAAAMMGKEEKYMTETLVNFKGLKEKMPDVGPVIERLVNMGLAPIRASERNYTTYLNKLRVDTFSQMADEFIVKGMIPEENPELYKGLARFVNSATGRGSMEGFARSAQILNTIFFSPRLMKARFDMLNPSMYANLPGPVRKKALTDMGKTIAAGMTFVGLMKLGGAQVETDPRSSDWMKPKIGNTRIDPWGGFQQYVKLFARMGTNEMKTSSGQMKKTTKWDEAKRFLGYKVAPTPAYIKEYMSGRKTMGGEFEYMPEEKLIPMVYQDLKEIYDENPNLLFMTGPLGFHGVGIQTYQPKPPKF